MATKTTEAERRWRRIVHKWRRSGLSARDFAEREGVNALTMYGWSSRLGKPPTAMPPMVTPTFVPVEIINEVRPISQSTPVHLEVVLPRGEVIRVPPGVDPSELGRVVAALRGGLA